MSKYFFTVAPYVVAQSLKILFLCINNTICSVRSVGPLQPQCSMRRKRGLPELPSGVTEKPSRLLQNHHWPCVNFAPGEISFAHIGTVCFFCTSRRSRFAGTVVAVFPPYCFGAPELDMLNSGLAARSPGCPHRSGHPRFQRFCAALIPFD